MSQDSPPYDAPLSGEAFQLVLDRIEIVGRFVAADGPLYDDFLETLERVDFGPAMAPELDELLALRRDWIRRLAEALKKVTEIYEEGQPCPGRQS